MAVRIRRVSILLAALAAAAVLAPMGSAKSRDVAPNAMPTLYVVYTMNCTFTIVDDFGRRVTSIAPGSYQIEVSTPIMFKLVVPGGPDVDHIAPNDFSGCRGWVQFQLTGPGVDVFTTLDSGCDAFLLLPAATFKANATYTFQDLNQPAATRTTLTVAASGSPTNPQSPYTATSGKGTLSKDLIGSAIGTAALRGTLTGTLNARGNAALTRAGKPVLALRAGRYKFVVADRSPKRSFTLRLVTGKTSVLTTAAFVGTRSRTLTLKAGRWMFSSGRGPAHYFLVTR